MQKVTWNKVANHYMQVATMNLCNGTQETLIFGFLGVKFFVGIERVGCYRFPIDCWISGAYVSEKIYNYRETADAYIIADWINCQLDCYEMQQGKYNIHQLLNDTDNYFQIILLEPNFITTENTE